MTPSVQRSGETGHVWWPVCTPGGLSAGLGHPGLVGWAALPRGSGRGGLGLAEGAASVTPPSSARLALQPPVPVWRGCGGSQVGERGPRASRAGRGLPAGLPLRVAESPACVSLCSPHTACCGRVGSGTLCLPPPSSGLTLPRPLSFHFLKQA